MLITIFGRHKLVPTLRSGKVWQIWRFAMFLSISLPLSRNLTPSITISYVNESRRWQTFSLFALSKLAYSLFVLSELVCTKKVPYPIHYSLLIYPKLILLWSVPDRQTDGQGSSPLVPLFFFFHWAHGALPAGANLLGWPNWGVDGQLN